MSSLFKSSSQSTSSSPYKGLPGFVKGYYSRDVGRTEDTLKQAGKLQRYLGNNPEIFSDLSEEEMAALDQILMANEEGGARIDQAEAMLDPSYYENPYTEDVVDTTLDGMRRQYAQDAVLRNASEASYGGNTGTRSAIMAALGQDFHNRSMASTEAGLRDDAFRFGVTAGQQGAGVLAGLAESDFGRESSTAAARGTYGAMGRDIMDKRANAKRTSKVDALSWYTDVLNSTRQLPATGSQSTTQPGPSMASQVLGGASTAAGIWALLSDRRAKTDIEVEDNALDKIRNLKAYSYEYEKGAGHTDKRTSGLMADDLRESGIVGAVLDGPDGLDRVDPYPILATVVAAVKELDARTRPGLGLA